VLGSLQSGRGECVDFADLFTTLARTQGIASRTVYGIAYSALPSPGFRFHAWNEILRDGKWHSVDPTWNQTVADATHIALSDQTLAALASAMQRETIAFTPVTWDYRSDAL
jgi:transglutaminase-like putative cysteine protease